MAGVQAELQSVRKRLQDSTQEASNLRSQLAAATQESQGLSDQLVKLKAQAADTDRRLNEEVKALCNGGSAAIMHVAPA